MVSKYGNQHFCICNKAYLLLLYGLWWNCLAVRNRRITNLKQIATHLTVTVGQSKEPSTPILYPQQQLVPDIWGNTLKNRLCNSNISLDYLPQLSGLCSEGPSWACGDNFVINRPWQQMMVLLQLHLHKSWSYSHANCWPWSHLLLYCKRDII